MEESSGGNVKVMPEVATRGVPMSYFKASAEGGFASGMTPQVGFASDERGLYYRLPANLTAD